jgi:PAS domain S-box-containing protein
MSEKGIITEIISRPGIQKIIKMIKSTLIETYARLCAGLVIGIAVLGFIGLIWNIPLLSTFSSEYKPIAFTAVCGWIIFGTVLTIHIKYPLQGILGRGIQCLLGIISCVSFIMGVQLITVGHSFIENVIISSTQSYFAQSLTSISPVATLLFVLVSMGLILLIESEMEMYPKKQITQLVGFSGGLTFIIASLFLLSYCFNNPFFYHTQIIPIAAPSALAGWFMGISLILSAGSHIYPLSLLTGSTIRAILIRRFVPLTTAIIITLSIIQIQLSEFYQHNGTLFISIFIICAILLTWAVISTLSDHINTRIEIANRKQQETEDQLRRRNEELLTAYYRISTSEKELKDTIEELLQKEEELHKTLHNLQIEEKKFRSLFDHMKEGVVLHEIIANSDNIPLDYRIIEANPAFEDHTGISPDTVKGRLATDAYQTRPAPYLEEYATVAETGNAIIFETFFSPMAKHFCISVFSPEKGFFATVFQDITKRKNWEIEIKRINEELSIKNEELAASYEEIASSEEEIRSQMDEMIQTQNKVIQSERKLALAQKVGKTGSFEMILKTEDIIGSDEFFRIFGIEKNESKIVTFEEFKSCTLKYQEILYGFVKLIQEGGSFHIPVSIQPADGSDLRHIRLVAQPIYDDDGIPTQILGVIQDITDEYAVEMNLIKTKDYLENLISHANSLIIVWDPHGMITEFNHAFEHITGINRDDALNQHISTVFSPESTPFFMENIQRMMLQNKLEGIELPVQDKEGNIRAISWNSAHIKDQEGNLLGIIAQGVDVTNQKLLMREKNTALKQIERNMAELSILNDGIRNPLTIITCLVENLDSEIADKILTAVKMIDDMIYQLDRRWYESEKILEFLRKHYEIETPQTLSR